MVNIVGKHPSTHIELDPPLTSDIQGIARSVSHWVRHSTSAAAVGADAALAVQAALAQPGQVATLILPGDTAWNDGGCVHRATCPTRPTRPSCPSCPTTRCRV